jgi:hypothetical protein
VEASLEASLLSKPPGDVSPSITKNVFDTGAIPGNITVNGQVPLANAVPVTTSLPLVSVVLVPEAQGNTYE